LNPGPPEYGVGVLITRPRRSADSEVKKPKSITYTSLKSLHDMVFKNASNPISNRLQHIYVESTE